jgi:hypothetical protein
MNRWTVLFAAMLFSMIVAIGCSNGNGVGPVAPVSSPDITGSINGQSQTAHTSLLGYYEVTFDPISQTMEAVADRTANYTINIVPFLNSMPGSGISFGSLVVNSSDPDVLKVTVNFEWHHPFPTIEQYKVYDFMGVIISNGDLSTKYKTLKVGKRLSNTYMVNADGYTRWFNPSEFTTTLIFGWAPGGIQNLPGNAKLNPYKYYAKGLAPTGNLWTFLNGTSNNDGVFQSEAGRSMELEFPAAPAGDGLTFAYAAVCCWEEQGTGPYTPYHRPEAIACRATVTPNLYYVSSSNQGGNLIADIDIWSWDEQPSVVKVESTVLAASHDTDPGIPGGDNYSTYHVDIPKDVTMSGTTGQEFWVVAESAGYNYVNVDGVAAPSSTTPLAAFWRFPLTIASEPFNVAPDCDLIVVTPMPVEGYLSVPVEFDASASMDPDPGDTIYFEWDFDDDHVYSEDPDDNFTGTETNPIHAFTEDYTGVVNVRVSDQWNHASVCTSENLDITVSDLFAETFDSSPANWAYSELMWEACGPYGGPVWSTNGPNGPSGSGNVRFPSSGNNLSGGVLEHVVTLPFGVPTGAAEANLRVYFTMGFGGSWNGFMNSNWKMVESSTPGLAPFNNTNPSPLPSGGVYLQNAMTHGSSFGAYQANPCFYGPLNNQPGWTGSLGGGAFPGSLTQWFDLILPASFYGKMVKVAFCYQTDECGYAGAGTGFAVDDYEVKTY